MDEPYDFGGFATKYNVRCTDGRTIKPNAFQTSNKKRVPLVWEHAVSDPDNYLGYVDLVHKDEGTYALGRFNETQNGQKARILVKHGDISGLSIYANNLVQQGADVIGGEIREVSIVFSGANPGARIDTVSFAHSADGVGEEAIIFSGENLSLEHSDTKDKDKPTMAADQKEGSTVNKEAASDEETIGDIFDTFTPKQKQVVYAIVSQALDEAADNQEEKIEHSEENMKYNIFDGKPVSAANPFTNPAEFSAVISDAQKSGSLKQAFLQHAQTYGIENIDFLFPDAQALTELPDVYANDSAWVSVFMGGTTHTPFSRIKTTATDLTVDKARAHGYVKGTLKKEEVLKLIKRVTTPTTVYVKERLDRDDLVDIRNLEVVAWLKNLMRAILNEEIARAALLSDGRDAADADKIDEERIRPIYKDDDFFAHRVRLAANATASDSIDEIITARSEYRGTGNPIMFASPAFVTSLLLLKDTTGRRLYSNMLELASALRVSDIVEVPTMSDTARNTDDTVPVHLHLQAILLNPRDYTFGADKGGDVSMFDDFDIDYNQYKYLMEGRCSGALTKPKSAMIIEKVATAG